ncbi:unnamed protein product [Didymodactylos carnosus]|uniref:B box-type domain-containing protein n=1 Tax=Didymodactylos carnosus TaxID=1234261 RepID=A0A8S2FG69_9BILA|nr:unnamed protein product [Didymodactylos carnosus]CAF4253106.1 unnamed protein product [Didymodactylos carnosus]
MCAKHADDKLKYWCTICSQLVYRDCLLFAHKDHMVVSIQDKCKKTMDEFRTFAKQNELKKSNLSTLSNKLTCALYEQQRKKEEMKTDIQQMTTKCLILLLKREKQLLEEIENSDQKQQLQLKRQQQQVRAQLEDLTTKDVFLGNTKWRLYFIVCKQK